MVSVFVALCGPHCDRIRRLLVLLFSPDPGLLALLHWTRIYRQERFCHKRRVSENDTLAAHERNFAVKTVKTYYETRMMKLSYAPDSNDVY